MENETLFAEEAEPPGGLTGVLDSKQQTGCLFPAGGIQPPSPAVRTVIPRSKSGIPEHPRVSAFRKKFFPDVTDEEWSDFPDR